MEQTQKRNTAKEGSRHAWLYTATALVLLLLFGMFINRHLSIRALYGDDLYLWSFYGCEDFWSFTFPKVTKGNSITWRAAARVPTCAPASAFSS